MSKDIWENGEIQVTAFVGRNGAACVQIGMKGGNDYSKLSESDCRELALALLARVGRVPGYRATD